MSIQTCTIKHTLFIPRTQRTEQQSVDLEILFRINTMHAPHIKTSLFIPLQTLSFLHKLNFSFSFFSILIERNLIYLHSSFYKTNARTHMSILVCFVKCVKIKQARMNT